MSGSTTTRWCSSDPLFLTSIRNNLVLMACVPIMIVVALVLALLLFEQRKAAPLYRFILFTPYIISITVSGIAFSAMLTKNGALNQMLEAAGLGFLRQDWLGDPKIALLSVGAVIIWRETVLGIILFVARLLSLSTEPLEAAMVDGASRWRAHWSVTLPQMRGIIGFYAITSVITVAVWTFSYVFVMTNGGPGNATMTADLYIYQNAFTVAQMNLAASAATLVLIAAIGVVAVRRCCRELWRAMMESESVSRQSEAVEKQRHRASASRLPPPDFVSAEYVQQAILLLASLVALFPLWFMVWTAIRSQEDYFRSPLGWPQRHPLGQFHPGLRREHRPLGAQLDHRYRRGSAPGDAHQRAGRLRLRAAAVQGIGFLLKIFVFLMVIPPIVMLLPLFSLMNALGRVNHVDSVIVAYAGLMFPFSVFMMTRYIETIPTDLYEAAFVEGASHARILSSIVVPLIVPALLTLGIVNALWAWNELLIAVVMLQREESRTLQAGLALLKGKNTMDIPLVMAGATISAIPLLLLYLFGQRVFMSGLLAGAVKE